MKLVMCCDYGLDDAVATADALSHAREDGYEEVDLVAVGGNVPRAVALRNAKKLVANLPFQTQPVVIVDTTAEEQPERFLTQIHGGDGMGDLLEERPCKAPVLPFGAWLRALRAPFDLLSLGPMTLVPRILARSPRNFVFMGGNIDEEPNYEGYEFNHALDRAAFSACVKRPHTAVTMDTCRHPLLNIQNGFDAGDDLMSRLVARSRELSLGWGEKGCYVWDDIAVKYLRHPEWFATRRAQDRDGNILDVAVYRLGKPYRDILAL